MLTEIKLVATASLAARRHAVRSMLGDDLSQDADIDHPLWSLKLDNGLHTQPIKDIGHSGRVRLSVLNRFWLNSLAATTGS